MTLTPIDFEKAQVTNGCHSISLVSVRSQDCNSFPAKAFVGLDTEEIEIEKNSDIVLPAHILFFIQIEWS